MFYVWHQTVTHTWHYPGHQVEKEVEDGQGKHGGERWRKRAELGLKSWAAAAAVAKNRDRWRALTSGPIPPPGGKELRRIMQQMSHLETS